MVERLKYKLVGLGIVLLLGWMGLAPQTCRGAVIWTDNFDDGTFEPEWTSVNNTATGWMENPEWGFRGSNWSAANDYVQMLPSIGRWGTIRRSSDVAYGTWSFDFNLNLTEPFIDSLASIIGFVQIAFMSNDPHDMNDSDDGYNYGIRIFPVRWGLDYDLAISLGWFNYGEGTVLANYTFPVPLTGWHHIDVTRTTDGLISVYHNGCLIMQAVNTVIDTSETFCMRSQAWHSIDNIVVDDEVLPIQCGIPLWIPIVIGVVVAVVVIVVVIVFLRRRRTAQ